MKQTFVDKTLISRIARAEIKQHDDFIAEGVGKALGEIMRACEQRCAALEAKIAEFKFVGQWLEGKTYKAGNFCSMGGQLYHANADTNSRPGTDSTWTLAVKSGRDGRDGKDFTPADPPEQRTVKSKR